jgi:phosphatidylglycerophosphate synthase
MSAVALALDLVDGMVARRTRTTSRFGARFDMEVDAFLIFVLSVYVAHTTAWWVIAIGLARYVFVAARWVFPRLTGSVPPRFWCKVVAAVQGIVLTIAAADVLPVGAMQIALAVALVLLAESFGREAWQLWHAQPGAHDESPHPTGAGMRADG